MITQQRYIGEVNSTCTAQVVVTYTVGYSGVNLRELRQHLELHNTSQVNVAKFTVYVSPIPVRSAVKSYLTSCCIQNLSTRALSWFPLTWTTQFGNSYIPLHGPDRTSALCLTWYGIRKYQLTVFLRKILARFKSLSQVDLTIKIVIILR